MKRVAEVSLSMRTLLAVVFLQALLLVLPRMKALAWWMRLRLTVRLPLALVWKPSLLRTPPCSSSQQSGQILEEIEIRKLNYFRTSLRISRYQKYVNVSKTARAA